MADTGPLSQTSTWTFPRIGAVTLLRIAIIAAILLTWEVVAASGWLYKDVVPSFLAIAKALFNLLTTRVMVCQADFSLGPIPFRWELWMPEFYCHLGRTAREIGLALLFGGGFGLPVRLALGANRFL